MPERLTPERRKRVIDLWRSGLRFQQISSRAGVSLGSISKIVGEERAAVPDIQELRGLGLSLKKARADLKSRQ